MGGGARHHAGDPRAVPDPGRAGADQKDPRPTIDNDPPTSAPKLDTLLPFGKDVLSESAKDAAILQVRIDRAEVRTATNETEQNGLVQGSIVS